MARPPLAADRLVERPDGTPTLRLKTPWRDGTTHMSMERSDLLDRPVPLIAPPRRERRHDPGLEPHVEVVRRAWVAYAATSCEVPRGDEELAEAILSAAEGTTGRLAIPKLRGTEDNAPTGAGAFRFFQNWINRGILVAREASL